MLVGTPSVASATQQPCLPGCPPTHVAPCAVPVPVSVLQCMFYCLFHLYLNILGEVRLLTAFEVQA